MRIIAMFLSHAAMDGQKSILRFFTRIKRLGISTLSISLGSVKWSEIRVASAGITEQLVLALL